MSERPRTGIVLVPSLADVQAATPKCPRLCPAVEFAQHDPGPWRPRSGYPLRQVNGVSWWCDACREMVEHADVLPVLIATSGPVA